MSISSKAVRSALKNIKGRQSEKEGVKYLLARRTGPDHTFIEFMPGVGILRYTYGHHGTGAEADLRLVEFQKQ